MILNLPALVDDTPYRSGEDMTHAYCGKCLRCKALDTYVAAYREYLEETGYFSEPLAVIHVRGS